MSSLPRTGYIVQIANDRPKPQLVWMYDAMQRAYVPTYAANSNYNAAAAATTNLNATTIQQLQARSRTSASTAGGRGRINGSQIMQYVQQSNGQSSAVRPSYVVPVGAAAAAVRAIRSNSVNYRRSAQPVTPPPPTHSAQQAAASPYATIARRSQQQQQQQQMVNGVRNMNMNVNYNAARSQPLFYSNSRQQTPPMQQQSTRSQYSYASQRSVTPPTQAQVNSNGVNSAHVNRYPPKLVNGLFYDNPPPPPLKQYMPKKKERPKPKIITAEEWLKQQHDKEQQQVETQFLYDELTKNIKSEKEKAEVLVRLTIEHQAKKKKDKLLASQRVERQKILQRELAEEQSNLAQILQNLQFYTAQFRKAQQTGTQQKIYPEVQNYRNQQQEAMDKINSFTKELEEIRYRNRMSQQADLERKIKRTEYGINRSHKRSYYNNNYNHNYYNKRSY